MPTKRSKSRNRIDVIHGAVLTAVEQMWAQTRASFARAQRATRRMQLTERIPEPSTRLVN